MEEAIESGYVKPLASVYITSNKISERMTFITCLVKSKYINLPAGYVSDPEIVTNPEETTLTIANEYG